MTQTVLARCVGCGRSPLDIEVYVELAEEQGEEITDGFMIAEEGTYNPSNGHFYCDACYIAAGMPLGVAP